jgi:hypothetical protein
MYCEFCGGSEFEKIPSERREVCSSCELYNTAVAAQKAAAHDLATRRYPDAKDAWLNEHGVFARVDGIAIQLGSPEEAAPFVALTAAARRVKVFQPRPAAKPTRAA